MRLDHNFTLHSNGTANNRLRFRIRRKNTNRELITQLFHTDCSAATVGRVESTLPDGQSIEFQWEISESDIVTSDTYLTCQPPELQQKAAEEAEIPRPKFMTYH